MARKTPIDRYRNIDTAYRGERDGEGLTVDERLVKALHAASDAFADIGDRLARDDLRALETQGRFIESRKRDIYQNARIPLWPLRRNASFHVVAMDAVFSGDQALTRNMLGEISALVEKRPFYRE